MKAYKILPIVVTLGMLASCGSTSSGDKKSQLEKLKKEQVKITEQIKKLEAEIGKADPAATDEKLKIVGFTPVAISAFEHFVTIQGKVESEENANVSAETPGRITAVYVVEGQNVKKGQVLAQLDNEVLTNGIEELKTSLALATTVYERQKSLWDQKIGTEVQYLQAKTTKESLERKLATMNSQINMAKIKSPINGTVDAVIARVGETASPGMPSFRVINTQKLKAKANVSEGYAANIKQGDRVHVNMPDINKDFTSKLSFVSHTIDPTSRSFSVEVRMNPDPSLRANMVAVLNIVDYSNPNAVTIPVNTIQTTDGNSFVYLAETVNGKSTAKKQNVKVGRINNDRAEIVSGLTAGDKLITVGFQGLNDGEGIKF
ncbi:efflux RND transporter periplasmic adaptor subunit [Solitalea koreensis]|uniref:RND family efflux transporter, MFP subunit n=1 Tax=Solitalea koreensis TaxID=543615 RepID=A0A521E199_9SPHI|nr:efflux RND transporter periplasmic adaptor subunit [Solitalea koreensis]SMO77757.1 RND family efflux transporter, MFP subunit [Solitalea koreensis]